MVFMQTQQLEQKLKKKASKHTYVHMRTWYITEAVP